MTEVHNILKVEKPLYRGSRLTGLDEVGPTPRDESIALEELAVGPWGKEEKSQHRGWRTSETERGRKEWGSKTTSSSTSSKDSFLHTHPPCKKLWKVLITSEIRRKCKLTIELTVLEGPPSPKGRSVDHCDYSFSFGRLRTKTRTSNKRETFEFLRRDTEVIWLQSTDTRNHTQGKVVTRFMGYPGKLGSHNPLKELYKVIAEGREVKKDRRRIWRSISP